MPQPLLAVDAPSALFRAFYALPDTITDKDGQPVNALLGALNMIFRVVADYDPRAIVLCFGPDAADYRTELYAGYHAQRPPVPPDLDRQFAESKDFFGAFGWTVARTPDHEADDLLHSYAEAEAEAEDDGARVVVGDHAEDHVERAEQGVDRLAVLVRDRVGQRVEGAVEQMGGVRDE